jgi:hypothetical protein
MDLSDHQPDGVVRVNELTAEHAQVVVATGAVSRGLDFGHLG